MPDVLDVLLIAADKVWSVRNDKARHLDAAIDELHRVAERIKKRRLQGSTEELLYMSGPASSVGKNAFTLGPASSLEELQPDPDHVVVVKNTSGDIINRFWAETGEVYE